MRTQIIARQFHGSERAYDGLGMIYKLQIFNWESVKPNSYCGAGVNFAYNFLDFIATVTHLATAIPGAFSTDPVIDLILDGYGAGYNHDMFNDVYSFFDERPVIRQ